jgi:hypothetical protein
VLIEFPGQWGDGPIFGWLRERESLTITALELRKEHSSFKHEYIVAYLCDGEIYRFDRRPDPSVPIDAIMRSGCVSFDTVQEVSSFLDLQPSDCIARLGIPGKVGLSDIILICYRIKNDISASRYSLQKFNCYFFAWSLVSTSLRIASIAEGHERASIYRQSHNLDVLCGEICSHTLDSDFVQTAVATVGTCLTQIAESMLPESMKAYPLGPEEQEEMKLFIKTNLASGQIWLSISPQASPFFFIRKKDGWPWLVQDYQKLNAKTRQNRYPLPLIQELCNQVKGAKYFLKFDIQWGFNNICIKKGDEWKAAFRTNMGLFKPMVMFFRLTNSPATFQAMMDDILHILLDGGTVVVYIDNILIFSMDEESHWRTTEIIPNPKG